MNFAEAVALIRAHSRFLLCTHAAPDGDGLGSQIALASLLRQLGKAVSIVNPHIAPEKFRLVDPLGRIEVYSPGKKLPDVDLVFILDTNETLMLGELEKPVLALGKRAVFVDHHVPEGQSAVDHLIHESYGATGELIHDLFVAAGVELDEEAALGIYVAVVTDTGGFRYRRTQARTHSIAARCLEKGVAPETVFHRIYAQNSLSKTRLLGHLLEHIQVAADGKLAWMEITQALREKYQATIEDTEAFVNYLTLIEGVKIAALYREDPDGRVKVSLRGTSEIPVVGVAHEFGGGGHRFAAGMKVALSLPDAVRAINKSCEKLL